MRLARTALALLAFACVATSAMAQSGGLIVKVTDVNGPLPGATVTLSHPLGYVKTTAMQSDSRGIVDFPVLRATGQTGQGYTIAVAMSGFAEQRVNNIKVRIGDRTELPLQLSERIEERIEVVADSQVVNLEKTTQSTKFSDAFISDLPVPGRFYQNILTLAPGVQDSDGDGNPNVHGSRARDFKALVSGISNVDPLTGQQMSQVNPNSIEEMEVITAGAGVEFSRAQGGFARILQKQGSNEFEGVFELFYRSDLLDGDGAGDFSDIERPGFDWVQPAVQVSGPVIRDKLWYRLSHELINREIPTNVTTGIVVVEDDWGIHSDQITWQASPRNKLAFQFQADPRTIDNFGASSSTPADSAILIDRESETFSLTWTAPFSPKVLVESQVAWQDLNSGVFPATRDASNNCLTGPDFLEDARCFNLDTGETSGSYPFDINDHRQRLTVRGDATLYGGRFWGMTHRFHFGGIVENERYFRDLTTRPDVNFFIFDPIADPSDPTNDPDPVGIIFGNFSVPEQAQVRATGTTWGFYAEDQIKPRQNLTLTIGARIDREETDSNGREPFVPEEEFAHYKTLIDGGIEPEQAVQLPFTAYEALDDFYRQLADTLQLDFDFIKSRQTSAALLSSFWDKTRRADNISVTNTNVSPFFSIAWDPWSDGKSKIAFTARRYYDKVFLQLPLIELQPASAFVAFQASQIGGEWVIPPGAEGLRSSISPAVNVSALDRDLDTPHQDELTLTVEREIATEASLKFTYIRRKFRDQYQDLDLNHVPGDFGRCRLATPTNRTVIEPVLDIDPEYDPALAPGDGIIDDCSGDIDAVQPVGSTSVLLERPDGIADLYVQNPGWGNVYLVGNFNRIDYEAFVLELIRRQYRSWELQGSYTYSKAEGDGEDYQQALGDDRTLVEDERGYQSYDQRHVVKLNATSVTPWGFRLGGAMTWQSGLPYSILDRRISFDAIPPELGNVGAAGAGRPRTIYPSQSRNDERNASYWDINIRVSKELNLRRGVNMQVSAEVFNLLNDNTYQVFNPITESGQQVNGNNTAIRRFGRQWQIGVKLAF